MPSPRRSGSARSAADERPGARGVFSDQNPQKRTQQARQVLADLYADETVPPQGERQQIAARKVAFLLGEKASRHALIIENQTDLSV